jgi:hypothetical protein
LTVRRVRPVFGGVISGAVVDVNNPFELHVREEANLGDRFVQPGALANS